jgi:hypothetical protein
VQKSVPVFCLHSVNEAANGNVPFYAYWADGKEDTKQRVMFAKMWQTDNLENPASGRRLKMVNLIGAYDWAFSDTTDKTSTAVVESTFTMTGTASGGTGSKDVPKPGIMFTNHLVSTTNGTELKFDIDISGYADDWWHESAKGLVMAYRIETMDASAAAKNMSMKGVSLDLLKSACHLWHWRLSVVCTCPLASH